MEELEEYVVEALEQASRNEWDWSHCIVSAEDYSDYWFVENIDELEIAIRVIHDMDEPIKMVITRG